MRSGPEDSYTLSNRSNANLYERGTFGEISGVRWREQDVGTLARLGKAQELKRRFGFLSLFGFSCTILITWETALALLKQTLSNGGPAGIAWGFPIVWICSTSIFMVIAEMASIAPIAGGQYFWVSMLAPKYCRRFLSYITGWLTSMAWVSTLASGMIFTGTILQGLIVLNYPDYDAKPYQGTLISWGILAVGVLVTTFAAGLLPFLESIILIIHTMAFVGILIPLVYLGNHVPASDVFFLPLNLGGWPTQGLSYCVGFIGTVGAFVGADAAVHMSEEVENAAMNVPRAILITLVLNGAIGYGLILAVLFCMTDIQAALESPTGFPFLQILADNTSVGGATAMTSFLIALGSFAVIGFLATSSRMIWSFARDKALPFHRFWRKVHPSTAIPVRTIGLVAVIPCLLALIYIGSPVVYEDVVSLSVSGLYASYLLPSSLLLWRRLKGEIRPYEREEYISNPYPLRVRQSSAVQGPVSPSREDRLNEENVIDVPLMWGPWKLPGWFGTLNNAFACTYCVFVLFWDFWPPQYPATASTMNYSVVVTGGVLIFSIIYYYLYGKKEYLGPLVDENVRDDSPRQVD